MIAGFLTVIFAVLTCFLVQRKQEIARDVIEGRRRIELGEDINGASYAIAGCEVFSIVCGLLTLVCFGITIWTLATLPVSPLH